jgi:hypothetical protein
MTAKKAFRTVYGLETNMHTPMILEHITTEDYFIELSQGRVGFGVTILTKDLQKCFDKNCVFSTRGMANDYIEELKK